MSHGDAITEVPPGFVATATVRVPPWPPCTTPSAGSSGCSSTPGRPHRTGQRGLRAVPARCLRVPPGLDARLHHRAAGRRRAGPGGLRTGPVRPEWWGRLGRGGRPGPQGHRGPADLRLRGHRPDAIGEADQVEDTFRRQFKIDLIHVKAADRYFAALVGVTDPERKRKIIGSSSSGSSRRWRRPGRRAGGAGDEGPKYLVQGTLYPDVIESGSDTAANIKSHHNVGGLPDDLAFDLVEPLRLLFKDEVRAVGGSSACRTTSCGASRSRSRPRRPHHRRGHPAARRSCAMPTPSWSRRSGGRALPKSGKFRRHAGGADRRGHGRRAYLRLSHRHPRRHQHDAMTADWARLPTTDRAAFVAHHQRGQRGQPGPSTSLPSPRPPSNGSERGTSERQWLASCSTWTRSTRSKPPR